MKNLLLDTLEGIAENFDTLTQNILGPVLIVIGALAAIYAIVLGVQYAKAEDANKRKEVQGRLIGAAIGVVIIIVGVTLVYAIDWSTVYNAAGSANANNGQQAATSLVWKLFR